MVPTELGGFREVSFGVKGEGAFRHLQFESGGHRVQRVPETETQGRIHTSAATVAVLPEPEDVDIVIRTEDLQVDVDAVRRPRRPAPEQDRERRPDHPPAQRHRRQLPRRAEPAQEPGQGDAHPPQPALRPDRPRRPAPSATEPRRTLIGSGDRSQRIRTYSFPQNRVTDHRIGLTLYNLDRVIQGDLAPLTTALIDHDRREQLGEV